MPDLEKLLDDLRAICANAWVADTQGRERAAERLFKREIEKRQEIIDFVKDMMK